MEKITTLGQCTPYRGKMPQYKCAGEINQAKIEEKKAA